MYFGTYAIVFSSQGLNEVWNLYTNILFQMQICATHKVTEHDYDDTLKHLFTLK